MGQKVCGFLSRPTRTIEGETLPLQKTQPPRAAAVSADSCDFPQLPIVNTTPQKSSPFPKSDAASEVTTSVGLDDGGDDEDEEAKDEDTGKGKGKRKRSKNKKGGKGKGKGKEANGEGKGKSKGKGKGTAA